MQNGINKNIANPIYDHIHIGIEAHDNNQAKV